MIGITALQRRILILMYTLWKKDEEFIDNYENESVSKAGRSEIPLPAQDELQPNRTEFSFV